MELLENIGNAKLPSVIKDPFGKTKVTKITVSFEDFWNSGKWKARGYVYFKNGDTCGDQKFEGETFDEVVLKIKSMLGNLK